jgi:uncharacterized protein (TIGR02569 family)
VSSADQPAPPPDVVAAFGGSGDAVPLSGGRRTVWRVGAVALKPLDSDPETLAWQEALLTGLDGRADFRVAPPVRSRGGALIVDGWTAWRFEPGQHEAGRWLDIIAVGRGFHRAVNEVPRPVWLDRRVDPWAVADRVAWGEVAPTEYVGVPHVRELMGLLRPLEAPAQLIHGDLSGNVLFADGRPPLLLDLSPYWRPPLTSAAIVVADALVHAAADRNLVEAVADRPDFAQYLLRALIFRVVAHAELGDDDFGRFAAPVRLALDLAVGA